MLMPAGRDPSVNPMGTVMQGRPVGGAIIPLLLPAGLCRSPIRRGGLLHVGYMKASRFAVSALGGSQNPAYNCGSSTVPLTCASGTFPTIAG
jgi:hypothetical protein